MAYYSAADGRNLDLYEIGLPGGLQPEQVSTVAGTAVSQDGKPLDAEITCSRPGQELLNPISSGGWPGPSVP